MWKKIKIHYTVKYCSNVIQDVYHTTSVWIKIHGSSKNLSFSTFLFTTLLFSEVQLVSYFFFLMVSRIYSMVFHPFLE
jgi:hypothetical protein